MPDLDVLVVEVVVSLMGAEEEIGRSQVSTPGTGDVF